MAMGSLSSAARSASAVHGAYHPAPIRGGLNTTAKGASNSGDKVTNKAARAAVTKDQAKANERYANDGNVGAHETTIHDAIQKAYGSTLPAAAKSELDASVKAALRETYKNGIADEHGRTKWGLMWGIPVGIIAASMVGTGLGVWHEGAQKDKVIRRLQAQQDSSN